MRFNIISASLATLFVSIAAQDGSLTQSLLTTLADRSDVSKFKALLSLIPTLIDDVVGDAKNDPTLEGDGVTLLIPNDDALGPFLVEHPDLTELETTLRSILSYHVMTAPLVGANFTEPRGLTIPTFLDGIDELGTSFNLRDPAPAIQQQFGEGATGQVVFAKVEGVDGNVVRLRTRQDDGVNVQTQLSGGMAQTAAMTIVDGIWEGGVYQIVDAILLPPAPCSNTIRSLRDILESLDVAFTRTDLWATLNQSPNVTCLAPNSDAFQAAGSPEEKLSDEELAKIIHDHTLVMPTYTNFLLDGMKIQTLSNTTVRVAVNESGIYFNDAKVVKSNILTNNGVIHVLDKLMVVEDTPDDNDSGTDALGLNKVLMVSVALAAALII